MSPTASELPPAFRGRAFSTSEARRAGIPQSRLRRADLRRPFHGTRISSPELDFLERCHALQTRMDDRHFFSHTTAARILGLPLPRRHEVEDALHIAVIPPFRASKCRGVIGHQARVDPAHVIVWSGLRIPRPPEVWIQLGGLLSIDELVQAGDALTRRQSPPTSVDALGRAVDEAFHRRGVANLKRALALVRPRSDSNTTATITGTTDPSTPRTSTGFGVSRNRDGGWCASTAPTWRTVPPRPWRA